MVQERPEGTSGSKSTGHGLSTSAFGSNCTVRCHSRCSRVAWTRSQRCREARLLFVTVQMPDQKDAARLAELGALCARSALHPPSRSTATEDLFEDANYIQIQHRAAGECVVSRHHQADGRGSQTPGRVGPSWTRRRSSAGMRGRPEPSAHRPWHFLNFKPLPHQHGSLRPGRVAGCPEVAAGGGLAPVPAGWACF